MADVSAMHRAHSMMWKAHGLLRSGRVGDAADLYRRALAVFDAAGARRFATEARANVGLVLLSQGRQDEARATLERALADAKAEGDPRLELAIGEALGGLVADRGELDRAAALLQRTLELAEGLGELNQVGGALLSLAGLHHDRGRLEEARAFAERARDIAGQTLNHRLGAAAACRVAGVDQEAGGTAVQVWDHALAACEATGAPDDRATALLGRGAFHVDQDDRSAAVHDLEAALAAFVDLGDPHGQAAAWTGLAVLAARCGDGARAAELMDKVGRLSGDHPARRAALAVHRGQIALAEGDGVGAMEALEAGDWPARSARVRRAVRWLQQSLVLQGAADG